MNAETDLSHWSTTNSFPLIQNCTFQSFPWWAEKGVFRIPIIALQFQQIGGNVGHPTENTVSSPIY